MIKRGLVELRRLFFVGIFTATPIALTLWLIVQLFGWFDGLFSPIVGIIHNYTGYTVPGLGFIVGIIFILFIGVLAPSLLGRQVIKITENIVHRLPLIKLVYSGTKQIFDSFSESSLSKFSRVVMVPFPKEGTYVIGFVTKEVPEGWVPGHPENKISVFLPTTPNPTSGYLLFVKESEAISLDIKVDDALKVVISGGMVRPPDLANRISQTTPKT
jgi:uncharacterized membrane protein